MVCTAPPKSAMRLPSGWRRTLVSITWSPMARRILSGAILVTWNEYLDSLNVMSTGNELIERMLCTEVWPCTRQHTRPQEGGNQALWSS